MALLLLILVAGVIRLWGIGEKSLWVDEAHALWVAEHDLGWIRDHCARADSHEPPARYFLMHFLSDLGRNTAFAVRLPALLAGLALIPILWRLGNLLAGAPAGILCALVAATSPTLIEHSQDARYYTLLLALEFGGLVALMAAWRRPEATGLWVAAGLSSALAFHVSYVAAFVVAPVGAILFLHAVLPLGELTARRALRRGAIIGFICFAVPLLPWAPEILRTLGRYLHILPTPPAETASPLAGVALQRHVPEWGVDLAGELLHPFGACAILVGHLAVVGILVCWREHPRFFLPLALIAVITPALVLGTSMRHSLFPRYLIHLHVIALLLTGVALGPLWRFGPPLGTWLTGLLSAAMVLGAAPAAVHHLTTERQDWRAAVEFIEARFEPGDIVITGAHWAEAPVAHYVSEPRVQRALRLRVMADEEFRRLLIFNASIWYVGWSEIPPYIQAHLDREFTPAATFEGTNGDVHIWKKGTLAEPPPEGD